MNAADLDVLWNRIAVAQSRSQRIVESWLPPVHEGREGKEQGTEAGNEPDALDAELAASSFSDTAGVGYRPSTSTLEDAAPRRSLASNERLRSLLLGSQAGKGGKKAPAMSASIGSGRPTERLMGSESQPAVGQAPGPRGKERTDLSYRNQGQRQINKGPMHAMKVPRAESSDEEELGRSAIGRKRQK